MTEEKTLMARRGQSERSGLASAAQRKVRGWAMTALGTKRTNRAVG